MRWKWVQLKTFWLAWSKTSWEWAVRKLWLHQLLCVWSCHDLPHHQDCQESWVRSERWWQAGQLRTTFTPSHQQSLVDKPRWAPSWLQGQSIIASSCHHQDFNCRVMQIIKIKHMLEETNHFEQIWLEQQLDKFRNIWLWREGPLCGILMLDQFCKLWG